MTKFTVRSVSPAFPFDLYSTRSLTKNGQRCVLRRARCLQQQQYQQPCKQDPTGVLVLHRPLINSFHDDADCRERVLKTARSLRRELKRAGVCHCHNSQPLYG